MTAVSQDFTLYIGNNAAPQFAVVDGAGAAIDLSSVSEITWVAQRTPSDAAVITKTKTAGAITFVNTGTDGKFQVAIIPADVAALSGYYFHYATITDSSGNITTVGLGRLNIAPTAPSTWTYSGDPTVSIKDEVRFLVGDTDESDPQLQDAEIAYAVTTYGSAFRAAIYCCRALMGKYGRLVSKSVGDLRISYSDRFTHYKEMAAQLAADAFGSDAQVYAGGQTVTDKQTVESNTDRLVPAFRIGIMDNPTPPDAVRSYDETQYDRQ